MSEPTETSPHILVVDDDRRIRSLLQKFLSDQGYRASSAASSNEARRKLSLEIFDLIVLDVMTSRTIKSKISRLSFRLASLELAALLALYP